MKKCNYLIKLIALCILSSFVFTSRACAIDKPTYSDMIKGRYGDEISDEQAKSLAQEESTVKEAYVKGIGTVLQDELESQEIKYYGVYPSGYTGAVNFRRLNFALLAYSLRDIDGAKGKQPLVSCIKEIPNFDCTGFNTRSWTEYGSSSVNTIKWMLNQFEVKKILRVYEGSDYFVLSKIQSGKYGDIIKEKDNLFEVVSLIGKNRLDELERGDLLLNFNTETNKANFVGIFLGEDENGNYYSLSPNKLVYNSRDYASNVWALSYINSTDVYPQEIDNRINLVSGTKYNYAIKMKFLN